MNATELNKIKMRWTTDNVGQGLAALMGKDYSPFPPLDDGFIDLRGLPITEIVKSITINTVDLSGAVFEKFGQFAMCNFERARFGFASLGTNIGGSFTLCDFRSAKLSGAVLRGAYLDCDFSMAKLTSAMGNQVRFVKCVFVKTDFTKATFIHCSFEDCRFEECKFRSGSFAFSKFTRSPISSEDLGNTLMEKVIFA